MSACSVRPGTVEDLSSIVRDMMLYPFIHTDAQLSWGSVGSGAWLYTHTLRDQVFWAQLESRFFLNPWCPNFDDPFQGHRPQ